MSIFSLVPTWDLQIPPSFAAETCKLYSRGDLSIADHFSARARFNTDDNVSDLETQSLKTALPITDQFGPQAVVSDGIDIPGGGNTYRIGRFRFRALGEMPQSQLASNAICRSSLLFRCALNPPTM